MCLLFRLGLKARLLWSGMDTKTTIQPKTPQSRASAELERVRKSLFSPQVVKKGKMTEAEEEQEKARRQAQDEYMDRLEKQFVQR